MKACLEGGQKDLCFALVRPVAVRSVSLWLQSPAPRLCSFLLLQPLALHLFLTMAELAEEEHGGLEVMGARIIWVSHFLLQQQRREVQAWA